MCIIALSPAGVDLPDEEDIKYMFRKNPDGAGFAIQGDTKGDGVFRVEYQKGFMNVDDFLEALGPRDKLKDFTVAMHFRIKTSGNVDKATTHPFPLSSLYGDLKKTEGRGPVLFHNGVFQGLGGKIDKDASDTQDFVVGVAMKYLRRAGMPGAVAQAVVGQIAGSCRVLIMYEKESFPMLKLGQWYEHKGNWYSNTGYRDDTRLARYFGSASYDSGRFKYKKSLNYRSKTVEDLDEYGCNIAPYAYPDSIGWLRCESRERFDAVMKGAHDETNTPEGLTCKFYSTGETLWYVDEANLELYTEERMEDVDTRDLEELCLEQFGIDASSEYVCFEDEFQMLEWADLGTKISEYEVKFQGKLWYLDVVNLEAWTEDGIKRFFSTGQQGHVKRYLTKEGTIFGHGCEPDFERSPVDDIDDDDDVSSLLPVVIDQEEFDELGRS